MDAKKIFFSYSRLDGSEFTLKLANDLRRAGANVWVDQLDIPAGKTWDVEIERSLESSQTVICVVSERSCVSDNVLNEVYYAMDSNKDVVPVIIHDCKIPFRLKRLQYIDFTKDYQTSFNRLLRNLEMAKDEPEPSRNPILSPTGTKRPTEDFPPVRPELPKSNPIVTGSESRGSLFDYSKNKGIYYGLIIILIVAIFIVIDSMRNNKASSANYESSDGTDATTTPSGTDTTYSDAGTSSGGTESETGTGTDGTETESESVDSASVD